MVTKQALLPFQIGTLLLLFIIGNLTAQNNIQIVIQNDASEYPALLFYHYFKPNEDTFKACGLPLTAIFEQNDFNCNDQSLYCTFSLERDSFACKVKNCHTNQYVTRKYHSNISDDQLLASWKDNFLNLLFQIDTSSISSIKDCKRLLPFLKDKEILLTHDNLLKNNQLCECLEDSIKIAFENLASYNDELHWQELLLAQREILEIHFNTPNVLKILYYLSNIKTIVLNSDWNDLNKTQLDLIKKANVSVTLSRKKESHAERNRIEKLRNLLIANTIKVN